MKVNERLAKVISDVFEVDQSQVTLQSDVDSIDGWDSLGHLNLIMAVEKEFGVRFPTEQMVLLDSVEKIQNTLREMNAI